jgi:RHS repeat-associated protein
MQKQRDINRIQTLIFMQRLCTFLLILKYLNWIKAVIDANSSTTYAYDPLYRLTQASGPWGSIQYNYDPVGNRTVESADAGVTNYTYDANKLISSTGIKPFTFGYDNNGNTISENQRQYIYNQNQRLIKVTDTGTTVLGEYVYNGNGQRVKKVASGKTTYFIYDQSGNLIEEADENGEVISDYIYLGGTPIARVDEWWEGIQTPQAPTGVKVTPGDRQLTVSWNASPEQVDGYKVYWGTQSRDYRNTADAGKATSYTITELTNGVSYYIAVTAYADLKETYYFHTDHLGTPIMMTDKNQNIVWNGELLPFGEPYSITGTIKNNLRFPGQYYDAETGLYQNGFRDYKAEVGRYIQFDPILHPANGPPQCCGCGKVQNIPIFSFEALLETPQALNSFVYVQNRPAFLTDVTGLGPNTECIKYAEDCSEGNLYACIAYDACYFGNPIWGGANSTKNKCVRNCLLDKYRAGCKDPLCGGEHLECFKKCKDECIK